MKLVINLVLLAAAGLLVWSLANSIKEPIAFEKERTTREDAVIARLKNIRTAQQLYREVTNAGYAPTFDTLISVLKNGRIPIVSVFGDVDDPNFDGTIRFDTLYVSAQDSINTLKITLDSLPFVPYAQGKKFEIDADTVRYQSTLVDVVEVKTTYNDFMGPFADKRFQRYDQLYDPAKALKFGNMSSPSLSGSWDSK